MKKKNFKTAFDKLLGDDDPKSKSTTTVNDVRATFLINTVLLEKLKAISFWQKKKIKNVLNEALLEYFKNYEEKNGNITLPKGNVT